MSDELVIESKMGIAAIIPASPALQSPFALKVNIFQIYNAVVREYSVIVCNPDAWVGKDLIVKCDEKHCYIYIYIKIYISIHIHVS